MRIYLRRWPLKWEAPHAAKRNVGLAGERILAAEQRESLAPLPRLNSRMQQTPHSASLHARQLQNYKLPQSSQKTQRGYFGLDLLESSYEACLIYELRLRRIKI
jgi:hypothetical protein